MNAIELSNVEFAFGQTSSLTKGYSTPLFNIDYFSLARGEQLFLSGPSGSGKSTFLNLLAGVIVPQRGNIEIADQVINQLSSRKRDAFRADHIGYIFQQFNLIPYLSLIENVVLPCKLSRTRKKKAIEAFGSEIACAQHWLSALDLDSGLWNKSVYELSIGQQQRVAAARAFMGQPDLIIADEPTSSLDRARQTQFVEVLFELCQQQNSSLVFVSHDDTLASLFSSQQSLLDWAPKGGTHHDK
jgi:putative ABC transport system ATP-binding protein